MPRSTAPSAPSPARVLVVDDDPVIRSLLGDLFRQSGYAVESAADGADALALACAARPDLVVTDVCMPVVDGPGFLSGLAARGMGDVPSIAISAQNCPQSVHATRFLPKPFDIEVLLALVDELLSPATAAMSAPRARRAAA